MIETTYLIGNPEPFEETLRYYFSVNWDSSHTDNITPVFLSPNGVDSQIADLTKEISQNDILGKKPHGLVLFESTETIPLESASNSIRTIETVVQITIYARSKYEMSLFINHINDIIQDNMPNTSFRIKKSDGIQDSAITHFKQRKGVKFSQPLIKDKDGLLFISTGFLSCMWIKTKT